MNKVRAFFLSLLALAPLLTAARAEAAAPLTLDDLLARSARHFPLILQSLAERDAAAGDMLAAAGAFDVVFSAQATDRLAGTYSGSYVDAELRQPLGPLGANVFGGYRISGGEFPDYDGGNYTNRAGEARLGVVFSLLRDRSIDARRLAAADARLAFEQAEFELLLARIGVQRQAAVAYWRWIAAGRQLSVYQRLLEIAEARQSGLEEQVRRGAQAAIFLTENRQNIIRRQRLVREAQRDFDTASVELSLYYRDEDGRPTAPMASHLPSMPEVPDPAAAARLPVAPAFAAILARRPELRVLSAAIERARLETGYRRNELLPRLDLNAQVSKDFGGVAPDGFARDETDAYVGLRFSVPLQRREARGRLAAVEARMQAAQQEKRLAEDRIEAEIRNILIELETAEDLAVLARQEVQQANVIMDAERERFENGASDFFLVNLREEVAANAEITMIRASAHARIARSNFDAVAVDLGALGLSGLDS